jgi:alanine dehydrogenase
MKTLYLKENDVEELVNVPDVIDALDSAFREQADGRAWNNPRNRLRMPGATLHLMAGAIPGYFGYKAYTVGTGKVKFFFFLYSAQTTDLLAMIEADALGQKRTGAATGLATRVLSRLDSSVGTIFGAGWQAQTQLLAMDAVRDLKRVFIVSKRPERRDEFIRKMQPQVKAKLSRLSRAAVNLYSKANGCSRGLTSTRPEAICCFGVRSMKMWSFAQTGLSSTPSSRRN